MRLTRKDWIEAAMAALAEGGIQVVRIEALGRRMNATKGSFYWHFRDLRDLTDALLDAWEEESTNAIMARTEPLASDPATRLLEVMKLVARRDGRIDRGIRAWAAADPAAAARLESVDGRRLGFLQGIFGAIGFSPDEARARAHLVYTGMIGGHAVRNRLEPDERLALAELNHAVLTGRTLR